MDLLLLIIKSDVDAMLEGGAVGSEQAPIQTREREQYQGHGHPKEGEDLHAHAPLYVVQWRGFHIGAPGPNIIMIHIVTMIGERQRKILSQF